MAPLPSRGAGQSVTLPRFFMDRITSASTQRGQLFEFFLSKVFNILHNDQLS